MAARMRRPAAAAKHVAHPPDAVLPDAELPEAEPEDPASDGEDGEADAAPFEGGNPHDQGALAKKKKPNVNLIFLVPGWLHSVLGCRRRPRGEKRKWDQQEWAANSARKLTQLLNSLSCSTLMPPSCSALQSLQV